MLVDDCTLNVRGRRETSNTFETEVGLPQGDCLSPILFALYLAKAICYTTYRVKKTRMPRHWNLIMRIYQEELETMHTANHLTAAP